MKDLGGDLDGEVAGLGGELDDEVADLGGELVRRGPRRGGRPGRRVLGFGGGVEILDEDRKKGICRYGRWGNLAKGV